jgi:hypothetical protein
VERDVEDAVPYRRGYSGRVSRPFTGIFERRRNAKMLSDRRAKTMMTTPSDST